MTANLLYLQINETEFMYFIIAPSSTFSLVNLRKGRERKEGGKPCVTSVTIILFETTFPQTSHSFKQISL